MIWALIIFVAGTASLVFHAPPVIMWIVRNLLAWSPTYLLLIGWKHFRPEETRTAFFKRCFSGKFDVVITSITVLMNIFLEKHNNLIYSVFMHFGFNIVYVFLDADILFFEILTILYLIITSAAVLIRNKVVAASAPK